MIRMHYFLSIVALLLLSSCSTYDRSFGTTYTTLNETSGVIYRLDLSNQQLKHLPTTLDKCVALKMLNISGNKNLKLDAVFQSIPNPEQLEILILDSLELKEIPQTIRRFKNLKHLSLNNNPNANFEQIFEQVTSLPLTFLNLQNNELSTLPMSLVRLNRLESINLSNNAFSINQPFEVLSQLPELQSLWLTNNRILQLSSQISSLVTLRNLYIEHNLLEELPSSLSDLPKVWVVHAGHNRFKELPIVFTKMNALLLLHVNNNPIERIPEDYAQKDYSLMGIILDNNVLSVTDKKRWKKEFRNFFQASF